MIYNHTNLQCQVHFLYVITYCGEIVTRLAVFINHLLSTAMAMLTNKWKAYYDSNRKYRRKGEEIFVWVQKVADRSGQLIVNCATATFYQELAASEIVKNRRNTSGEPHYKTRHDLM